MTGSIEHNINTIRRNLPDTVKLMAVTKYVSTAAMREAYRVGVRDFGESRIQETEVKQHELADLPDIQWHLIGHLQGNKVRKALHLFDWIHSVDSLKLAQQIDRVSTELSLRAKIYLQVKILPDPDKYGWTVPELLIDLPQLDKLEQLDILGLMAIPPLGLTGMETQQLFQQARELQGKIQQQNWQQIQMSELSMGMSNDYQYAIVAESTVIRLGSVIFGDRIKG